MRLSHFSAGALGVTVANVNHEIARLPFLTIESSFLYNSIMLTRLYCNNFKCLDNFEFRPAATQLLMGRNGGGKSTVFEVLMLLRDFAVRGEDCEGRMLGKTRTRWQTVDIQRFELDVTGNGGAYAYELLINELGKPPWLYIQKERLSFDGNPLYVFEDGVVHLHDDQFVDRSQFSIMPRRSYLLGQLVSESDRDTDRPPVDARDIRIASDTLFQWTRPNAHPGPTCVASLLHAIPRWQRIG